MNFSISLYRIRPHRTDPRFSTSSKNFQTYFILFYSHSYFIIFWNFSTTPPSCRERVDEKVRCWSNLGYDQNLLWLHHRTKPEPPVKWILDRGSNLAIVPKYQNRGFGGWRCGFWFLWFLVFSKPPLWGVRRISCDSEEKWKMWRKNKKYAQISTYE